MRKGAHLSKHICVPNIWDLGRLCEPKFWFYVRGDGSTGVAGAFAPISFQQWVHCTRPDEEIPITLHSSVQKEAFWCKKCGTISNFGGERSLLYPWKIACTGPVRSLAPPLYVIRQLRTQCWVSSTASVCTLKNPRKNDKTPLQEIIYLDLYIIMIYLFKEPLLS